MSEDQQNDRDFFSRLNRYGETPPPQVREALQEKLAEKKKRRIGAFWWNTNGSAYVYRIAAIVVAGLFLFYFLRKSHQPDLPAVAEKSTPVTVPAVEPSGASSESASDSSSAVTAPVNKEPANESSPLLRQQPSGFSAPTPTLAHKSTVHQPRKKKISPDVKENNDLSRGSEPVPQREIVYGTSGSGEDNPFLPEESGIITPPAADGCEDETVAAVEQPVKVIQTVPGPLFPDSMKAGKGKNAGLSWSLAVSGGLSQWNNKYNDGAQPVESNSLENAENQRISFLGGAELRASFGNWMITSGVAYARQSEDWAFKTIRSDFGETGAAFVYNDTTIGSYTLLNGYDAAWSDPPVPGNTATLSNLTLTDTMIRNDYSRFSIPLLIGYRLKAGERMSLGLHTGVAYTNLFDADVWLYNITDRTVQRTDEKDGVWRRNSFDALFRIEAAYAVSDRFSLLLRPAGSLMLTSQFKENYPARRRSLRQSVEAGVVLMW